MKPTTLGPRQVGLTWFPAGPPLADHADRDEIDHAHIAARLKRRSGVWARLDDFPAIHTSGIRLGRISAYRPGGSFECRAVAGVMYVRYVGEGSL